MQSISLGAGRIKSIWYLQKNSHWLKQCCGAGAALFGRSRSRENRGGSGSSSTAQAAAMTPCLKKGYNKNFNNNVNYKLICPF